MGVVINNSFIRFSDVVSFIGGSSSSQVAEPIGQIFRVANTTSISAGEYVYTNINGNSTSTGNIIPGEFTYILTQSGSATDVPNQFGLFTITNLLITASVDETPTFTEELITTVGSGTWTKPAGVTEVIVECWGGGGAGGGATDADSGGGGGAGGQYARKLILYNSTQQSISYSVAQSVTGIIGNGSIGNDTTWDTNVVVAKGGAGGQTSQGSGINFISEGGAGSTLNGIGDVVYAGGTGGTGVFLGLDSIAKGGRGGGGAGSSESVLNAAPTGGVEFGGNGGNEIQINSSAVVGNNGSNYGGGGSGAAKISGPNRSGGAGAQGLIRIIYR